MFIRTKTSCNILISPVLEFGLTDFEPAIIEAALEVFRNGEETDSYPAWGMSDPIKAMQYAADNIFSGNG